MTQGGDNTTPHDTEAPVHPDVLSQQNENLAKANEALMAKVLESRRAEKAVRSQMAALTQTLGLLAAEPERDSFIGEVLKAITTQLGANSGGFWLYDDSAKILSLHLDYDAGHIAPAAPLQSLNANADSIGTGNGLYITFEPASETHETGKHLGVTVYDDIANDPRLEKCRAHLLARGTRTLFLIPLYLENELIGSFSVHSKRQRSYLHGEIELAQALVQQAGLAIQWARTAEQSRQAAVLEERNRLAREIHDSLAQSFTGILIQLGVAQRISSSSPDDAWGLIEHVRLLAIQGLAEARRSVWALQPNAQEFTDLGTTLQGHIDRILANGSIQGIVHIHGNARVLPSDVGLNLLRIAQEAVNNAVQHSQAPQVFVELTFEDAQVKLFVQDNGQGFDAQHQENGGGVGLTGMRQRAERIGGHLTIVSTPGAGTEVAVTAPIPSMPVGGQKTQ